MVWLYEREGDHVRVETRYDNATSSYQLTIIWPEGEERREQFADLDAFRQRLNQLSTELDDQRWQQAGPPKLLPDGWRSSTH